MMRHNRLNVVYTDAGGQFGPHDAPIGRSDLVWVLVVGAIYVYLYQRTYAPGS